MKLYLCYNETCIHQIENEQISLKSLLEGKQSLISSFSQIVPPFTWKFFLNNFSTMELSNQKGKYYLILREIYMVQIYN